MMTRITELMTVIGVTAALLGPLSHEGLGLTVQEKRAQGDEILKRTSEKLRSVQAMTFSTTESIERTKRNDEMETVNLRREVVVRRPNRLWFKVTGDRNLEGFYDGKRVTLVSHKEKVYGEFPAAPTLDETADMIAARYDISLPIADLLTENPEAALKDAETSGGFEKQEKVGGVECNLLTYQHPNVDFSIWIPVSGEPLPRKMHVKHKARRGQPNTIVEFRDWNLSPELNDRMFIAAIPSGFELIPVIQRASAVTSQLKEPAGADKPSKNQSGTKDAD